MPTVTCSLTQPVFIGGETGFIESVPPGSVVMGVPAKVRREVTEEERAGLRRYAENYVRYKDDYRKAEEAE